MRFIVLEGNPLTVWDITLEKAIHLGSHLDAIDLADQMNAMHDKAVSLEDRLVKALVRLGKLPEGSIQL